MLSKRISFFLILLICFSFQLVITFVVSYGFKDTNKPNIPSTSSIGGEEWYVTWGGSSSEGCEAIALDSLKNIYLAGYREQSDEYDICLVKLDNSGNEIWHDNTENQT